MIPSISMLSVNSENVIRFLLNIKEDVLAQKIKVKEGVFVFPVFSHNNYFMYKVKIYMAGYMLQFSI